MRKYRLWFKLSLGFLSLLAADAALFILTGMTLFDPNKNLQAARLMVLGIGALLVCIQTIDDSHIVKE